MPLSPQAQLIYRALLSHRERNPGKVITYGQLELATRIPAISQRIPLEEIFEACDAKRLPPLTAIVVQQGTSTPEGRYGTPGEGYYVADQASGNLAGRDHGADLARRVRRHQDSVHDYSDNWPPRL